MQRLRMVYAGRVQGVGFRATTVGIAARFPVTGWVRNQADGTVELEAQGDPETVQAFLKAIQAHFARHISRSESEALPAEAAERGFMVR